MALLDPKDAWHARVVPVWAEVVERCVTTEAVLTEASHLCGRGRGHAVRALEFLLAAGIPLAPLDPPALRHAAALMQRYARVPMDFADATLVTVADALGIGEIFTTDRRGFRAYRGSRGLAFMLRPA